jgi:hypothetical protein
MAGQRRLWLASRARLPAGQVIAGQLGQQVGGVHHHVFHHLAHAGLDLGGEHAQHEEGRNAVDEEERETAGGCPGAWVYSQFNQK